MQEEEALPKTPEGCGAEFLAARDSLTDVVGQTRPHLMRGEDAGLNNSQVRRTSHLYH
jgi:hypothetical protein